MTRMRQHHQRTSRECTAVFGNTMVISEPAGLNRVAGCRAETAGRPREEWTEIPVPAIVTNETFDRVQRRLADNNRYAARNIKVRSLLQGLAACSACGYGYGYYRTFTRTTNNTIYYYRCLGSDDYRHPGGPRDTAPATRTPPVRQGGPA
jgi:hypothetical protein